MRFLTVACLFVLSIFGAQLVRIQGFDATAVAQEAQLKREAAQIIPAMRGQVLASDGTVLASSVVREVVVADQTAVCTYGTGRTTCDSATSADAVQRAATKLAPLLDTTVSELVSDLTGTSRYKVLSREVTPLTWNTISAMGIPGIYRDRRETRSERTYPQGSTTAALVGYMTGAGEPGGGVELMMEKHLVGTPGRQTFEQGRDGTIIPVGQSSLVPAVDGNDVTLTVNSSLQWYAQNALAQRIKETKAASGTVVIEDVKTGNLLAVASYPSFDPNTDVGKKGTQLSNVAFSDVFEPGSTSKIMTMAAALEEGTVTPSTPVVIPNRLPRYDANFKDSHEHPTEYRTVAGTLAESSNIGTILVSETMKSKTLESYFRKFGLGRAVGHRVPGGVPRPARPVEPVERHQAGHRRVRPGHLGHRGPGRLGVPDDRQRRRAGRTPPGREHDRRRRHADHDAGVGDEAGRLAPDGRGPLPHARGRGEPRRHRRGGPDPGLPGRRQDRHAQTTTTPPPAATADAPRASSATPRPTTRRSWSRSSSRSRPTRFFGGYVAGPVFKDVATYALQELKIPPTGTKAPKVTLKVTPEEALADPTVLRNGHKRSDR